MSDDESRLSNAVASLSMEGLEVTESEKQLARKCMCHEITYNDAVEQLIRKYSEQYSGIDHEKQNDTLIRYPRIHSDICLVLDKNCNR